MKQLKGVSGDYRLRGSDGDFIRNDNYLNEQH
jgi:hypothetical protein